jgi:hypothetical protein
MKYTRTNKKHNANKKIKIAVIATLTVLSLGFIALTTAIYLQPAHYEGTTFTNAKTSISSTTSSTSSSSSNSSTSSNDSDTDTNPVYTESNTNEVEQNAGDRAYQPTFEIECVSPKNDLYCVEHIPTGDKTKAIQYSQAESFYAYMEQIAYGKTTLSYTMDENYETWLTSNH